MLSGITLEPHLLLFLYNINLLDFEGFAALAGWNGGPDVVFFCFNLTYGSANVIRDMGSLKKRCYQNKRF